MLSKTLFRTIPKVPVLVIDTFISVYRAQGVLLPIKFPGMNIFRVVKRWR
jgi:hypothetical protein